MSLHLPPRAACGMLTVALVVAASMHHLGVDGSRHQTAAVRAHSLPGPNGSTGGGHDASHEEGGGGADPSRSEACSDRHIQLKRVMEDRLHRSRQYIDLLATATVRVKDFHTSRVPETGDAYRATVKDIKASDHRATTSTEAMAAAMQRFDCGDDKIEPVVRSYTTQLDTLADTLDTYRDNVVTLIDRVKNSTSATSSNRDAERR